MMVALRAWLWLAAHRAPRGPGSGFGLPWALASPSTLGCVACVRALGPERRFLGITSDIPHLLLKLAQDWTRRDARAHCYSCRTLSQRPVGPGPQLCHLKRRTENVLWDVEQDRLH